MSDEPVNPSAREHSPLVPVLRWIGVLPGAALASVLVRALVILLSYLYLDREEIVSASWYTKLWRFGFAGAALGSVFVYTGTWIAPRHRQAVAVALAGVVVFLSGASVVIGVDMHDRWGVVEAAFMIVGAAGAAIGIRRSHDDRLWRE